MKLFSRNDDARFVFVSPVMRTLYAFCLLVARRGWWVLLALATLVFLTASGMLDWFWWLFS